MHILRNLLLFSAIPALSLGRESEPNPKDIQFSMNLHPHPNSKECAILTIFDKNGAAFKEMAQVIQECDVSSIYHDDPIHRYAHAMQELNIDDGHYHIVGNPKTIGCAEEILVNAGMPIETGFAGLVCKKSKSSEWRQYVKDNEKNELEF